MNDPLLQLHDAILGELEEWSREHPIVERILDEFRAEWKVEGAGQATSGTISTRPARGWEPVTIIVPRAKEQTLVEAAKAVVAAIDERNILAGSLVEARADLAAALKKEEG